MSQDATLIATHGVDTTKYLIESETKKLSVLEQELLQLSDAYKSVSSRYSLWDEISSSLKSRIMVLSKDIKQCNAKIIALNSKLEEFKKSLAIE